MEKSPEAFRTISEVANELEVPQHVLRFWESKFSQVKPMKRGGGRRYYRPHDIELLRGIRRLLYGEGYTIRGVQKILKEHGVAFVAGGEAVSNGKAEPAGEDAAPEPAEPPVARPAKPSPEPVPQVTVTAPPVPEAAGNGGLKREQLQVLQATLYELSEVRKLLVESDD